jgi:tRNA(Arg) A34 adenosine deaminase TadA
MAENSDSPGVARPEWSFQPIMPGLKDAVKEDQERFDREIEDRYLGIQRVFDNFVLKGCPPDIYRELVEDRGEFPVEAAILRPRTHEYGGKTYTYYEQIVLAENTVNWNQRSDEHAELVALREAAKVLGDKHLPADCVLVTNVEPCTACAKSFLNYNGKTLIFGASHKDLQGDSTIVNGRAKYWRLEPEGYSAKDFILDRDPTVTIIGGYRKPEVLRYIDGMEGLPYRY